MRLINRYILEQLFVFEPLLRVIVVFDYIRHGIIRELKLSIGQTKRNYRLPFSHIYQNVSRSPCTSSRTLLHRHWSLGAGSAFSVVLHFCLSMFYKLVRRYAHKKREENAGPKVMMAEINAITERTSSMSTFFFCDIRRYFATWSS